MKKKNLKRSTRGYTVVELFFALGGISVVVLILWIAYVIAHFVSKFW